MFIDEAEVILKGGHGGPGKVSFYPGLKSGPDGGNGGKGGDIYTKATTDLTALKPFTFLKTLRAEDGQPGDRNRKSGRTGEDLEVYMPIGAVLIDTQTNEKFELNDKDDRFLICKGGKGGLGNFEFKSSRNTTPEYAQPGLPGEERHLKIQLKLIADYGLIGLPNAGKSSLLNELTKANVKTAPYPFTTLEPNLGVLAFRSRIGGSKIIADIPGLIEGASEGKGLGIKFLKHIEKTGALLHCISAESEDIKKDYLTVRKELEKYNPELLNKIEIILLTKSDLVEKKDLQKKLKTLSSVIPAKAGIHSIEKFMDPPIKLEDDNLVFPISIHDWDSLEKLKNLLKF